MKVRLTPLFIFLLMIGTPVLAFVPKEVILQKEYIAFLTPGLITPKYFTFEIGFVTDKKIDAIDYNFNAYAEAFLTEESYTTSPELRAAALGGKGGILLPTQPWLPLYLNTAFGFAKSALHKDPWFGDKDDSVSQKDLFFIEGGLLYAYEGRILFRYNYQLGTVKYFTKKSLFAIGINF